MNDPQQEQRRQRRQPEVIITDADCPVVAASHEHQADRILANDNSYCCSSSSSSSSSSSLDPFAQEEQQVLNIVIPTTTTTSYGGQQEQQQEQGPTFKGRSTPNTRNEHVTLQLTQYGSSDDRWGIHSTVWDGGLALLAFLLQQQQPPPLNESTISSSSLSSSLPPRKTVVIDLGSGTGIVGLGLAAAAASVKPCDCCWSVAVTDIPTTLDLLRENVARNEHFWNSSNSTMVVPPPMVQALPWGASSWSLSGDNDNESNGQASRNDGYWLRTLLLQHHHHDEQEVPLPSPPRQRYRILITGADIVYRPLLVPPLLQTLQELPVRIATLLQQHQEVLDDVDIEIWLSIQSIRSNLREFCRLAMDAGFVVDLRAIVQLPPNHDCHMDRLVIHNNNNITSSMTDTKDNATDGDKSCSWWQQHSGTIHSDSDVFPYAPVRLGWVWILQLRQRP